MSGQKSDLPLTPHKGQAKQLRDYLRGCLLRQLLQGAEAVSQLLPFG